MLYYLEIFAKIDTCKTFYINRNVNNNADPTCVFCNTHTHTPETQNPQLCLLNANAGNDNFTRETRRTKKKKKYTRNIHFIYLLRKKRENMC